MDVVCRYTDPGLDSVLIGDPRDLAIFGKLAITTTTLPWFLENIPREESTLYT